MNLSNLKTEVKYLNCPFCGGIPEENIYMLFLSVKCSNCGVETKGVCGTMPTALMAAYNLSMEEAVKLSNLIRKNRAAELWNKRV